MINFKKTKLRLKLAYYERRHKKAWKKVQKYRNREDHKGHFKCIRWMRKSSDAFIKSNNVLIEILSD